MKQKNESVAATEATHFRRSGKHFDFLENCLFFGDKNPQWWREAYLCRTADRRGKMTFKEPIMKSSTTRDDEFGRTV